MGKTSVVHMLISVSHERSVTSANGKDIDLCPGLTMLLRFKPKVNLMDMEGRTPLVKAIVDSNETQAVKLVSTHTSYIHP